VSDNEITVEEAIAELSTPTGDPKKDAIRLSFAENMQLGYMQPAGRGGDGEITVKLTLAGKQFVEKMGKR
jgi:hypothetical protein